MVYNTVCIVLYTRHTCTCIGVEHLPHKQYVLDSNSTWAAIFSMVREILRVVALFCFDFYALIVSI